jgi:hypothetical protein
MAQARTNTRSDWVVLDFLLPLHQGKRRGKNIRLQSTPKKTKTITTNNYPN